MEARCQSTVYLRVSTFLIEVSPLSSTENFKMIATITVALNDEFAWWWGAVGSGGQWVVGGERQVNRAGRVCRVCQVCALSQSY